MIVPCLAREPGSLREGQAWHFWRTTALVLQTCHYLRVLGGGRRLIEGEVLLANGQLALRLGRFD